MSRRATPLDLLVRHRQANDTLDRIDQVLDRALRAVDTLTHDDGESDERHPAR